MENEGPFFNRLKRILVRNNIFTVIIVSIFLISIYLFVDYRQGKVEENAFILPTLDIIKGDTLSYRSKYEIAKLAAEIRQIRSDTGGSLFWLKMIGVLVTVGGAVGGYLLGQSHNTQKKLAYEHRKDVDAAYQALIGELSDKSPITRATAAVKLGSILKSFPSEWDVSETREQQVNQLTKQVLSAALAIEKDTKVSKTLSIALVLHKPWANDPEKEKKKLSDVQGLDLSGINANKAYWANSDFSYSDFYKAQLEYTSLRGSILNYSQFYETNLNNSVLVGVKGEATNFKLADLRKADLSEAQLNNPNFEGAKVFGIKLTKDSLKGPLGYKVDVSEGGDGSVMEDVETWLNSFQSKD